MFELLSWKSGVQCDKFSPPSLNTFVSRQPSALFNSQPKLKELKRKRIDDSGQTSSNSVSSQTPDIEHAMSPSSSNTTSALNERRDFTASRSLLTPASSPAVAAVSDNILTTNMSHDKASSRLERRSQSLQNNIQSQINLEILLKHKELRLIDQELAKCQVTLEQLRRCTEIPYPATMLSEQVSSGTGPALRKQTSGPMAQSPAPWGVTDGPYSRHYAKWLIPDARFDGGELDVRSKTVGGKMPAKTRSSRGSIAEVGATTSNSRTSRGGKLHSLPAGYGQPKEKNSGPMILKRKSDGVMVKLVCPDCARHDFGSAQGFINHCRIGHSRSFASHDQAAEHCGEPVEYDVTGAIVGIEPVSSTPVASNVHPLIRSARLLQQMPASPVSHGTMLAGPERVSAVSSQSHTVSPDFHGSGLTPHLSALIKTRGLGLNLQDLVSDAKTKMDCFESEDEDSMELDSQIPAADHGNHPHVAGTKQPAKSTSSPGPSFLLNSRMRVPSVNTAQVDDQYKASGLRGGLDMDDSSPAYSHVGEDLAAPTLEHSPTTESNQAPSLVDDDEEFEAHSPASSSESDNDENGGEVDFAIHDDEHDHAHVPVSPPDAQGGCGTNGPQLTARRPSAIRRATGTREERHVTFVSPSPARDMDEPITKRRKANAP